MKHHTVDMDRLSLIITGEYTPSAATKINRCVLIKMSGELPTEELTRLQQNQKNFLSFVAVFVSWLVYNFDNLTAMIKQNKEGIGVVKKCCYYDRKYKQQEKQVAPHMLLNCFFPYTKEGILNLLNNEICCDFTHMLITDGIDPDSDTTPLCGSL